MVVTIIIFNNDDNNINNNNNKNNNLYNDNKNLLLHVCNQVFLHQNNCDKKALSTCIFYYINS